jgi:predicted  nucleic acid-binding Zn-ribbon protein
MKIEQINDALTKMTENRDKLNTDLTLLQEEHEDLTRKFGNVSD